MGNINIAFILNGGLGSIIIGAEYIKRFYEAFRGENKFDVYAYLHPSKDVCDCVMRGANFVREYYAHCNFNTEMKKKYDVVIEVVFFPYIHYLREGLSFSNSLREYFDKTLSFQKSDEMCRLFSLKENVKQNIYKWGMINNLNRFNVADPLKLLNFSSDYSYTPNIYKEMKGVLKRFGLNEKQYITIQRGTNSGFSKESVRDWPVSYYEDLVNLLKQKYTQYTVVQLGESYENCVKIKGVDICLLGKTDLEDIKVLLKNSFLHIDGECGMVHLRKALKGGPSVVLMGAAPKDFFGYSENINLERRPCAGYCHGLTNTWYKKCLKWRKPMCMYSITPSDVIKSIDSLRDRPLKQKTKLAEILQNKNICLDKTWKDNWLKNQEIFEYYLDTIKIGDLKVRILSENGWKKISILESPCYKFVCGNTQAYEDYMNFKNLNYSDGNSNSVERYRSLIKELNKKFDPKFVVVVDYENVILDGQHRAAWALRKFGPDFKIKVVKIYGNFAIA